MQKFRRFIALGLVAAIAAIGPPVTAQAQDNTVYNESVATPLVLENVTVVVETSAGLDTIGVITIELFVTESPIPITQIAEAPEYVSNLSAADTAVAYVFASTNVFARPPAHARIMSVDLAPTARDALWRSSMTSSATPRTNSSSLIATSSTWERNSLLHLNL